MKTVSELMRKLFAICDCLRFFFCIAKEGISLYLTYYILIGTHYVVLSAMTLNHVVISCRIYNITRRFVMKSKEDLKTKRVFLRMTAAQYSVIQNKAAERDMNVSEYIITSALHSDKQVIPQQLARIQNLVAEYCMKNDPQKVYEIQEEVDSLWSSLK